MPPLDKKACDLAAEIVRIWENWSDGNEEASDNALRDCAKDIRTIDLHQVDGVIASPLNYFTRAYLDDDNPEDLTFCEMMDGMKVALGLMTGS
jgi:hypothetical protein